MENKHTPGPWRYEQETPKSGLDVYAGREYICTTSGNAKANGVLIAAAPQLLEALIELSNQAEANNDYECDTQLQHAVEHARIIIEKTTAQ